jgi:hypothetical protein
MSTTINLKTGEAKEGPKSLSGNSVLAHEALAFTACGEILEAVISGAGSPEDPAFLLRCTTK